MRNAASEIDDVDAAGELALRVGVRLAMLLRDRARDLVGVTLEKLLEAEHRLDAFERRRVPPACGCLLGCRHGRAHLARRRQLHLGRLLPGCWVIDGSGAR